MLYDENFVKPEIRDGWPVSEMIKNRGGFNLTFYRYLIGCAKA